MTTTDRQLEYSKYLRCRKCNRKTEGIEDFKSLRGEKITKTCIKCRKCVLKSQKESVKPRKKKLTNPQKIEKLLLLLSNIDDKIINKEKDKDLLKIYNSLKIN